MVEGFLVVRVLCVAISFRLTSSKIVHVAVANKSLHRTPDFGYAYFVFHPNSSLEVESPHQFHAESYKPCAVGCARKKTCISFNFGKKPIFFYQGKAQYLCELLSTDKYNSSSKYQSQNQDFDHYSIRSNCSKSPCLNNCTCIANYTEDTYKCLKDKWLKINTSPVCFGAKDSAYGSFNIKENGAVTTIKLVHLSGYVACVGDVTKRNNWGCELATKKFLSTIITDNTDHKILPQDEFIIHAIDSLYQLPGMTTMSPELIFQNFTPPMNVAAGQEYRIWYGQDLSNYTEGNNKGASCADVYMYGFFASGC